MAITKTLPKSGNAGRGFSVTKAITAQDAAINEALRDNFHRTAATFERIRASFATWNATRAATRELSQLNDRELADLGISRSDISSVVRGTYRNRG